MACFDPIADDEILYRRISLAQKNIDPETKQVQYTAFRPNQNDTNGLSMSRAKYNTPEQVAARGLTERQYYVAELQAGEICKRGMRLIADPTDDDMGHCLIANLTFENRRSTPAEEWQRELARVITQQVHGPFPGNRVST